MSKNNRDTRTSSPDPNETSSSSGAAFIAAMQTTDFLNCNNLADRLHRLYEESSVLRCDKVLAKHNPTGLSAGLPIAGEPASLSSLLHLDRVIRSMQF